MRPDASKPRVSGVILAAGASLRMGRPKQLLAVAGKPLLAHVVDAALASRLCEVVVVLGAHAEDVRACLRVSADNRLRVIVNEAYDEGMSSSLRKGLAACDGRSEGAAVLLADQPGVGPAVIDRMLAAFVGRSAPIVRPVYRRPDGTAVPGHPVVLARSVWPLLDSLTGEEGARALIARHPELLEPVDVGSDAPEDVDTPDDYRRACAAASASTR